MPGLNKLSVSMCGIKQEPSKAIYKFGDSTKLACLRQEVINKNYLHKAKRQNGLAFLVPIVENNQSGIKKIIRHFL